MKCCQDEQHDCLIMLHTTRSILAYQVCFFVLKMAPDFHYQSIWICQIPEVYDFQYESQHYNIIPAFELPTLRMTSVENCRCVTLVCSVMSCEETKHQL